MRRFDYLAIAPDGRETRGSLRATDGGAAESQLRRRRLYVVRIEEMQAPAAPALLSASRLGRPGRRLGQKPLTLFTRQLATMVQVTPVEEALRAISTQAEKADVRRVLGRVHQGVVEGRRLSEAMAAEGASFPPLYRAMVAAGEGAGTLPALLERLAALLERQAQVRGKILSALAYPIILALVAMFVVAALMIFVVPRVVEQFDTVGQRLPLITRVVIGLSDFLASWWWAIIAGLAMLALLAAQALRDEARRLRFDRALLRLPLVGRLMRDLNAARLARTLSTMAASRLPLLDGLRLTLPTVSNRALRAAAADMAESVRTGGSLSGALRRAGLFPPLLVYLAASGEASGRLDLMLERAADYLEREFDSFTATFLSLLEPAIIIVMGAVVAMIVLSILLPILQLDALAGGALP